MKSERRLEGLGISPGHRDRSGHSSRMTLSPFPNTRSNPTRSKPSSQRFAAAVALSIKQLRKLKTKAEGLPGTAKEEVGYLLDAHLAHAREFAPHARRRASHRDRAHQC